MRILISVDLEGINGVVHSSQTQPGEPGYERAISLMHQEVNAVIEGVKEAGAFEVTVNDAHWDMRNLRQELLSHPVNLVSGWQKPLSMMSGVDGGIDVVFFLGYHSKAGTAKGVLSHTYRAQVFFDVELNGKSIGELGLNAALSAWFGVPVGMVSGDDAVCAEAKAMLGPVTCVEVKKSLSRYAALCLPQAEVLTKLQLAAKQVLKEKSKWSLIKPPSPSCLGITFIDPAMADGAELLPNVKRVADRKIEVAHEDYAVLFKQFLAIGALGANRRDPYFS